MAANLNTPADFMVSKGDMQSNTAQKLELLPPSAFDSPKDENWRELAQATKEVIQLKLENQKLKEAHNVPIIIPAPAQDIRVTEEHKYHPPPPPPQEPDRKYVDELLTRQATELVDLKNELCTQKCKHREEIAVMEKESALREKKNLQTMASLEAELRVQEDKYITQVSRLSSDHEREVEELSGMVQTLKQELTSSVSRSAAKIKEMEAQLKMTEETLSSSTDRFQQELRSKEYTLENQQKQITQLKSYIGDSERAPKPVEVWRKEKETLENKLQMMEIERDNLQSNLQLLNVRMMSVSEILSLQESEISRSKHDKTDKEKRENLLTRWREKVFTLMVQQKSTDIVCKKDEQNWKSKILELEGELQSANSQKEVLSYSVSDLKAQLDMEHNNNKRLQQELTQAQQLALCLDDKLLNNRETMKATTELSTRVISNMEDKISTLMTALGTLKTFGQRISFASGRVEMLQGLFARRDALLQRQMEDITKSKAEREEIEETGAPDSVSHISAELDRVLKERDSLAAQLKLDSENFNERLQSATATYEADILKLRQTVEELELVLQEKSQRCLSLDEVLERTQRDLTESQEKVEELKTNLAQQQIHLQHALTEQRTALQTETADEMSDLNKKLDDARREHTKAVVSLRQLERQCTRDKERMTEHLRTVEEHYTRQVTQLQQQLQALEKDRNLMMSTLRQEGLIGKVKSNREEPVRLKEMEAHTEMAVSHHSESKPPSCADNDEPLAAVLEDLESLTTAVLKDVSSSDSED